VLWNVIPAWNGTRKLTGNEMKGAADELSHLLELLPKIDTVVLVGRIAGRAERFLPANIRVIKSDHPSPLVRAAHPDRWRAIPRVWRMALSSGAAAARPSNPQRIEAPSGSLKQQVPIQPVERDLFMEVRPQQPKGRRSAHQTHQAAQSAVASELHKRGYDVTFTTRDTIPVAHMKVISPTSKQHFLIAVTGLYKPNSWKIKPKATKEDGLYYVLALVPDEANNRFFILSQEQVNNYIRDELARLGRPDNYPSPGIDWKQAKAHEDKWDMLPQENRRALEQVISGLGRDRRLESTKESRAGRARPPTFRFQTVRRRPIQPSRSPGASSKKISACLCLTLLVDPLCALEARTCCEPPASASTLPTQRHLPSGKEPANCKGDKAVRRRVSPSSTMFALSSESRQQ
jgi:hypothetical protein